MSARENGGGDPRFGRPWTKEEDDIIRRRYRERRGRLTSALDRTQHAIWNRAKVLGVTIARHWTPAEDKVLRDNWGDWTVNTLGRRLRREANAIVQRAEKIGLQTRVPPGFETLSDAAERSGIDLRTLTNLLREEKGALRMTASIRNRPARWHRYYVDPLDVDDAVARWCASEPVETAARARGIDPMVLRRLLKKAGIKRGKKHAHWRIPSAEIDRVIAERQAYLAETETLTDAAARVGVSPNSLRSWLMAAGLAVGRLVRVYPAQVDWVTAKARENPNTRAWRKPRAMTKAA